MIRRDLFKGLAAVAASFIAKPLFALMPSKQDFLALANERFKSTVNAETDIRKMVLELVRKTDEDLKNNTGFYDSSL